MSSSSNQDNGHVGMTSTHSIDNDPLMDLFRKLHTLKGLAKIAGLRRVAGQVHAAEEVVVQWQDQVSTPTKQSLARLCMELAQIESSVESCEARSETREEIWELLSDCRDMAQELEAPDSPLGACSKQDTELARNVGALFRDLHSFKGLAKLSGLDELVDKAHDTEEQVRAWSGPGGRPEMKDAVKVRAQLRKLRGAVGRLPGSQDGVAEELSGLLERSGDALGKVEELAALQDPVAPLLRGLHTLKSRAKMENYGDLANRADAAEDLVEMWLGRSHEISRISAQTVRAELWGMLKCIGAMNVPMNEMDTAEELEAQVEKCARHLSALIS